MREILTQLGIQYLNEKIQSEDFYKSQKKKKIDNKQIVGVIVPQRKQKDEQTLKEKSLNKNHGCARTWKEA